MRQLMCLIALVVTSALACGPASPAPAVGGAASSSSSASTPAATKTLAVAIRFEPSSLAARALQQTGVTLNVTIRTFNAGLVVIDNHGQALPDLAETLTALNTDSWKVFDYGTMETTYKLRPHLTWHDGQPLTADDFVFAWQVYTNSAFGLATTAPQSLMEEVSAPDAQTFTTRWKQPYPFADVLDAMSSRSNFPPLPRHLLESPIEQLTPDAFLNLPFWTTGYVGAGPYKLDRWLPGSLIDASAFDGHSLGRPRIDRLELRFINEANAALSNMLSGTVQLLADDAIFFQQATVLKQQWSSTQAGSIVTTPGLWRYVIFQLAPEYSKVPALLDLRVRQALAHGLDRDAINEGVYGGEGIIADSIIPPTTDYFPIVDRAVTKYPFDPRRSDQLMRDAGFARDGDGFFTSPGTGRLPLELLVIQNAQGETEQNILAARWREVGFSIEQTLLPTAQAQDGQTRATFPEMFITSTPAGDRMIAVQGSASNPRLENHWNGFNRGHWLNADYDRLVSAYNTTLDRDRRIQQIAQMIAIYSTDLPGISMNFNPGITAFPAALSGPVQVGPDASVAWNIHQWELK